MLEEETLEEAEAPPELLAPPLELLLVELDPPELLEAAEPPAELAPSEELPP